MNHWTVHTDGGCRDNPGPGAWAFVVKDMNGAILHTCSGFLPHTTNNNAEYVALREACLHLLNTADLALSIQFYSDSQLMVNQVNGDWGVKQPLLEVFEETRALYWALGGRAEVEIAHIPRALNADADRLCNAVQDEHGVVSSKKGVKRNAGSLRGHHGAAEKGA